MSRETQSNIFTVTH